MPEKKTVDLDLSKLDPERVEVLEAGFNELFTRARSAKCPTAMGVMSWPSDAPRVWFVVGKDEGDGDDRLFHMAVCVDERTATMVLQMILEAFVVSGVAAARPV